MNEERWTFRVWKGCWTTWIKRDSLVIATGNEIHRMRQLLGPLVKRVTLVVANGARIFENDQMVLGKFWDRELVEAVLAYFKGREISDQLVVSAVNGGFVKEGTVFTEVEKIISRK